MFGVARQRRFQTLWLLSPSVATRVPVLVQNDTKGGQKQKSPTAAVNAVFTVACTRIYSIYNFSLHEVPFIYQYFFTVEHGGRRVCDEYGMALGRRAATMCGLLSLLWICVRFEAYSVLYLAFSMPGIAEFVTLSQHSGDGEGVAQPPALGSPVSVAIVAAYIYNSALALAIIEFPVRGMVLPEGGGNGAVERLFWDHFTAPHGAVLLSSTWHLFILCIVVITAECEC